MTIQLADYSYIKENIEKEWARVENYDYMDDEWYSGWWACKYYVEELLASRVNKQL